MVNRKRFVLVAKGGLFCAVLGSLLGGIVVAFIRVVQGSTGSVWEAVSFLPLAIVFASIPAAPFGFIVGSAGSWWLATRAASGVAGVRLYCESVLAGAVLGASFPLVLTILGWGPFNNLVSAMPISVGIGTVCAVTLIPFMRKYLPLRSSVDYGKGGV